MCLVYLTLFSCNHTVLTAYTPCAVGIHPQVCSPRSINVRVIKYDKTLTKLLPDCPCSRICRGTFSVPTHPTAFGEFCVQKQFGIEDVVAVTPAWVFDIEGKKIGTRSKPWRVSDYIVAFYLAKNAKTLHTRGSVAKAGNDSAWKRELEDDEPSAKRLKLESSRTFKTQVSDEDDEAEKVEGKSGADQMRSQMVSHIKQEI